MEHIWTKLNTKLRKRNECKFCGASVIEQVVCPQCRRANYDVGITKYICGSIRDSANEWFQSIECVEAELTRKNELLQKAGGLFNKWLYLEKRGLLTCAFSPKILARETNVFLDTVAKVMGEK